ncbi:(2Fe-2S)-binding protein [Maledivibacter halophilus]|uniref:NAD(P)H-nitrite reductase n=1 Tax=Maledivibacter halophilus TaxID=36842 RepID=A0A1T5JBU5_9FIRM|nr:(2Fe-2S)-binding protein [Maledivibacter halophilus]SKC48814.1 NAD(P)H-nitrite reductase [Maledivibacter halophilus]
MSDNNIICRCSDLTKEDIRKLIEQGYTTFDEIKRVSRAGMGPCQGRTCMPLILREISIITGKPISEIMPGTYRPPVKAITLGQIAEALEEGGNEDD